MSEMMKWTNVDPRKILKTKDIIVILRPSKNREGWESELGCIEPNYTIFTFFEDSKIITSNDTWNISWLWITGPS